MKTVTYLVAFSALILTFNAQSQGSCSSTINASSAAISNCNGIQISVSSTGAGPYQYVWSSPTLTISSTTIADPFVSSTTYGWQEITVVVIDGNNCTSVATDSIQFLAPFDTLYQTYCTLPDSVCALDIPILEILSWTYIDSSGTSTALPATNCVAIVGSGEYNFLGVYEPNCTVVHTYIVEEDCSSIGIEENLNDDELLIYPNPATSEINIQLPNSNCDRWEIIDLFGKTCLSGSSDQSNVTIGLSDIETGTYFVRVWNDKLISNSMVVKE